MSNAKERRHLARVKALSCVLCKYLGLADDSPVDVHHLKYATGAQDRSSHFLTVALCPPHHRVEYPGSVHALKEKGLRLRYNLSEIDLLAMTYEALET